VTSRYSGPPQAGRDSIVFVGANRSPYTPQQESRVKRFALRVKWAGRVAPKPDVAEAMLQSHTFLEVELGGVFRRVG